MMQFLQVMWLGASATLFALWVWMLCREMVQLSRDARHWRSAYSGTSSAIRMPISQLRRFFGKSDHQRQRRRLAALTAALLGVNAFGVVIWPSGLG
ncbi:hypothetical protein [Roseovarius arcticus]|uniref:hypothetical protein n=1 Tax=Roseovarius arcticus TaxID=2547404 RepID=UPI001110CE6E|nr:hypothetical protein [Roseovarius arcticus]